MIGGRAVISAPDITRDETMNISQSKQATYAEAVDILEDRFIGPKEIAEVLNPLRKRYGLHPYPNDTCYPELLLPYSLETLQGHVKRGWYLVYSHGTRLKSIYSMRGKTPPIVDKAGKNNEEHFPWPKTYLRPETFHLVYLANGLKGVAEKAQNLTRCVRASAVLAAYAFTAVKKTRYHIHDVGGFYHKNENVILALSESEDRISFYSYADLKDKNIITTSGACIYRLPDYA